MKKNVTLAKSQCVKSVFSINPTLLSKHEVGTLPSGLYKCCVSPIVYISILEDMYDTIETGYVHDGIIECISYVIDDISNIKVKSINGTLMNETVNEPDNEEQRNNVDKVRFVDYTVTDTSKIDDKHDDKLRYHRDIIIVNGKARIWKINTNTNTVSLETREYTEVDDVRKYSLDADSFVEISADNDEYFELELTPNSGVLTYAALENDKSYIGKSVHLIASDLVYMANGFISNGKCNIIDTLDYEKIYK